MFSLFTHRCANRALVKPLVNSQRRSNQTHTDCATDSLAKHIFSAYVAVTAVLGGIGGLLEYKERRDSNRRAFSFPFEVVTGVVLGVVVGPFVPAYLVYEALSEK